jgi:hypothetical protein
MKKKKQPIYIYINSKEKTYSIIMIVGSN